MRETARQDGTRDERQQRRVREAELRAVALEQLKQRQAKADAARAELARRGIGDPGLLAQVSHAEVVRLLRLAQDATVANLRMALDERERRIAAELEADEEQQRVELFSRLFDDAAALLERLAGRELPELVQLRAEAKAAHDAGAANGRDPVNGDVTERIVAKLDRKG